MFVIKRIDGGDARYVTPAGSERSYTRALRLARKFNRREDAAAHCCENERVVSVAEEIGGAA